MYSKLLLCFLLYLFITFSESFSVENLPKCSIKDKKCLRNLYQNTIRGIGELGIPEIGVPSIDPIALKNISVSLLDLAHITLIDGEATGVQDCIVNKFIMDIDTMIESEEITCDITIKGQYSLVSDNPILQNLIGAEGIHGDGIIKFDKIFMAWKFPFYLKKRKDGEIYLISKFKGFEYDYNVNGKAWFALDNVYLGKQNISKFINDFMNRNWKLLIQLLGKNFFDKAMYMYYHFGRKFFDTIPTRNFIIEDLTPYLKN